MNSLNDSSLMMQQHAAHHHRSPLSTSGRKTYYPDKGSSGKENVEQNKMPGHLNVTGRKSNITKSPSFRSRKTSDNSFDRPLRPRGLQEVDTSNSHVAVQKKRNHSTSDTSGGAKPFTKTRFSIYDDAQNKEASQRNEQVVNFKQNKTEKSTQKPLSLRENIKSNSITAQKNKENDEKPSSKPASSTKTSPADLPQISKANVFKIKEEHKKAPMTKKSPRVTYDIMSLELAYNIDYMCEYVRYQMDINEKKKLSSTFLTRGITADQRRLIVKYLITATTYHNYPSFILYQAIKIFDSYIDAVDVQVNELQASALAALWIALKKDLVTDDIPEASTIIKLAGSLFENNKKPLIECEKKILMSLNFEISFADPFSMLALYTVMIEEVRELKSSSVQELYYCGSYLIDLSLLHEKMFDISAVHLAATSAEIALILVMSSDEDMRSPQWTYWRNRVFMANSSLEKYRLPELQMDHIRNQLLQKVMLSKDISTDFHVVYKKYKTKRYGSVSKFVITRVSQLFLQRISDPVYTGHPIFF